MKEKVFSEENYKGKISSLEFTWVTWSSKDKQNNIIVNAEA